MMKISFLGIIPAPSTRCKISRLTNVAAWKNVQIVTNMLVVLLRALGVDLGLILGQILIL